MHVRQVEDQLHGLSGILPLSGKPGFSFERAKEKTERIFDTTLRVLQVADEQGVFPAVAADWMAEERMATVGRLRAIRLSRDW